MSKPKFISLEDARAKLTFPEGRAITRSSLYLYLEKFEIKPVLQKVNGRGWALAHITEAEFKKIQEDFKRIHWRKFKAAEKS